MCRLLGREGRDDRLQARAQPHGHVATRHSTPSTTWPSTTVSKMSARTPTQMASSCYSPPSKNARWLLGRWRHLRQSTLHFSRNRSVNHEFVWHTSVQRPRYALRLPVYLCKSAYSCGSIEHSRVPTRVPGNPGYLVVGGTGPGRKNGFGSGC